jgi:hypothetical protein
VGTNPTLGLDQYKFSNFYVYPQLRYNLQNTQKKIKSLDFTLRYEYLDRSTKFDSNPESSITPLLSISLLNNYAATISIGMNINQFNGQDYANNYMNNNQGVVNFKSRYNLIFYNYNNEANFLNILHCYIKK